MKVIKGTTKTIFIAVVLSLFLAPGQASAQSVSGRDFNIFVYSDTGLINDASTKIRFETNGALLIDAFDGFGAYLSAGPLFAGFFMAPDFDADDLDPYSSKDPRDLFIVLSGVVIGDFICALNISFIEMEYSETFFFYGYVY